MPGCYLEREVNGTVAWYRISGKFEGDSAWELSRRLLEEQHGELALDFSRVVEFVDYAIAVLSNALLSLEDTRIDVRGLRQHQLRMFQYFGVDPDELAHRHHRDAGSESGRPAEANA